MKDNTKFVILTMGRTGSSYICDLLNSHSSVECFYEIFKDFENKSDLSSMNFISSVLEKSDKKVCGFKMLEHQANYDFHKEIALNQDFKVILLKRKNPIDRYVSYKLAIETGTWHLDNQINPAVLERGLIDIISFKYSFKEILDRSINTFKAFYNKFTYKPVQLIIDKDELLESYKIEKEYHDLIEKDSNAQVNVIYYEDFLGEKKEDSLKELQAFLGLAPEELVSSRLKIDHHPLSERIANYNDLAESLQCTELSQYI